MLSFTFIAGHTGLYYSQLALLMFVTLIQIDAAFWWGYSLSKGRNSWINNAFYHFY
jgi:hypothetical protein